MDATPGSSPPGTPAPADAQGPAEPGAPPPEPAAPMPPPSVEHRFVFSGSGGEYFRIWIVNLLLTIVTVGIYGAWAKVRRLRYFYGHTSLAGSSFEYHAQPKQILVGRLIALALILPYYVLQYWRPLWSLLFLGLFLVALPFIVVRSQRFHLRMSSWRNVRFNYVGTYLNATAAYLGWGLLALLSFGLLIPVADQRRQRLKIAYSRFGGVPFEYRARLGRFYEAYLLALGAFVGVMLVMAIVIGFVTGLVTALASDGDGKKQGALAHATREVLHGQGSVAHRIGVLLLVALFYLVYFVVAFLPYAVIKARTTNESLGSTTLGRHRLHSRLGTADLWGILVSNLLLVVITLGLYAPWAQVRLLRYQLGNTSLIATGSLDDFINEPQVQTGAAAQELSDFMDLDFGL